MTKLVLILLILTFQLFSDAPLNSNNTVTFEKNIKSYNTPARIETQASWDIIASASFIYWHPKLIGLDLGILKSTNLSEHSDEIVDFETQFYPGFTALLGTNFHYDNWSGDIKYTRFHSKEKESQPLPSWSNGINYRSSETFSFIKSKWKQQIDFFDLVMGRPYYNGKNLVIKPNISARGGWTKQSYKINGFANNIFREIKLKSESWFVGPQVSADINWLFTYNFRIFINASISALYQKFNSDYFYLILSDPEVILRNFETKSKQITPNLDLKCGFALSSYFDHNNWHVDLLISYDFLYFWNQNEFTAIQNLIENFNFHATGDLMLHGLEISLKINF